jgi:hypothetical protein
MSKWPAIFFTAQIEGSLSTLHDALDRLTHIGNVYGSFASDLSSGLISGLSVITPGDQLRVTVDDKVCVVADENDLPLLFGLPKLLNNFLHYGIVEVLFGLIDKQRGTRLIQKRLEQCRSLLASGCFAEGNVIVFAGAILEHRQVFARVRKWIDARMLCIWLGKAEVVAFRLGNSKPVTLGSRVITAAGE